MRNSGHWVPGVGRFRPPPERAVREHSEAQWTLLVIDEENIVIQVLLEYNDFGQVAGDFQSHAGAVNTMSTPKVEYGYADGSTNTVRPTSLTYPSGRVLSYGYGTIDGIDDASSRIASLVDDDMAETHLASYAYLGRRSFVEVDYTQPEVKWTLVGTAGGDDPDTGDIYRGLDRFGRVKDNYWYDYGSSAEADRIKYGYDRNSNRTYRENVVATAQNKNFDELYLNDLINRLSHMDRGRLNGGKDGVTNLEFAQCWSLDETGNWKDFREDDNGSGWDLIQQRTANEVNEITGISETTGPSWATPSYDPAGNMTTMPQPSDPTGTYTATYDAWNRLVKLADGEDSVAEYQYDGRKFRVVAKNYTGGVLDETRHFYYTKDWQVIEERVDASSDPDRQFVWGLRYIDDCVLRDRDEERLYALQDANWNVTSLIDDSGDVQERFAYSPYGVPMFLSAGFVPQALSSFAWETLYAGYRYDAPTGLFCVRNRYLHPVLGVWVSRDEEEYVDSMNLYTYGAARVLIEIDPFGSFIWIPIIIAGVAILVSPSPAGAPGPGEYIPPANSGQIVRDILIIGGATQAGCLGLLRKGWNIMVNQRTATIAICGCMSQMSGHESIKLQCLVHLEACVRTKLNNPRKYPGSVHGETRCDTCFSACIANGGVWPSSYRTTRGRHSCRYGLDSYRSSAKQHQD